jgi:hypothetical protein
MPPPVSRTSARAGDGNDAPRRVDLAKQLAAYFATAVGAALSFVTPELVMSCFIDFSSPSR